MRFIATMLFVLIPLCAQDAPPPRPAGGGRAPTNLKVLTPQELQSGVMRTYTQALGVQCNFCHAQDRASDEIQKKIVARSMISMVKEINGRFPPAEGKVYVTCYTCHRGKTEPEIAPPATPGQP